MSIAALNHALTGMSLNLRRFEGHADRISRWGTTDPRTDEEPLQLHEELVGVMTARQGYEANLAVARAADEMLGTLIDILA